MLCRSCVTVVNGRLRPRRALTLRVRCSPPMPLVAAPVSAPARAPARSRVQRLDRIGDGVLSGAVPRGAPCSP